MKIQPKAFETKIEVQAKAEKKKRKNRAISHLTSLYANEKFEAIFLYSGIKL